MFARLKVPHTLVLLYGMIVFAWLLTLVLPAGTFETVVNDHGREMVVPGTFAPLADVSPPSFWSLFSVIPRGLADAQGRAEALVRSGYKEPGPALELLADIYERQGRYADAADLYRQAGSAGGGSAADDKRLQLRATRGRALAAAEQGDDLGATREFQNGLVLDPSDPWIRYEFAQFQIRRGRVPEAESLIRSLVANGQPDT